MGTIFKRGNRLWLKFKDEEGEWRNKSSGYELGQEEKARKLLKELEAKIAAAREGGFTETGLVTVSSYAKKWLTLRDQRGIASASDDRSRLNKYVMPRIGDFPIDEVRLRHVKQLVHELCTTPVQLHPRKKEKGIPAPRTIRHVYSILRTMMADAVVDELIEFNPCQLRRRDLPKKVDKDPSWRAKAVFTRGEVETLISSDLIPEDRRTFFTLLFFAGGLRFGEGAALRWRMYDTTVEPLGRLDVHSSYSTRIKKEKSVKTQVPRGVPVHPTLASVLAQWKLTGWEAMMGRKPTPDDLIVPSREGVCRSANHSLKKFHQDLKKLGFRKRRQQDLRRTFISLAIADGARKDILRWITHGPSGDIMDMYTTLPWDALCREMSKLKIGLLKGEVIELPKAAESGGRDGGFGTVLGTVPDSPGDRKEKSQESQGLLASHCERGGRDSNPRPPA